MPILKIMTNLSKSNIPKDFLTKIVPLLSSVLKKDAEIAKELTVHLVLDERRRRWTPDSLEDYPVPCRPYLHLPWSQVDHVEKSLPVTTAGANLPKRREIIKKFSCVVSTDCYLCRGQDSTSPGAVASLESIGHVSPNENKLIVREISDFIHKELNIHPDRFVITIYDMEPYNIGVGGEIFN